MECGENATLRVKKPPDKDPGRRGHKATSMIEEDNIDQHRPGKGLPSSFPVLLEEGEDITIEDIERMVDKATNLDKNGKDLKQLREELHELDKIACYTRAGWWEPAQVEQAAPMLCVKKKTNKLRTVIDGRQRNDNTIKDVTPLPDQDVIRLDVARAKIRSKIDLSDAYEQVCIVPSDVYKTAFATIYGTFVSNVMQQGDCNAPLMFQ